MATQLQRLAGALGYPETVAGDATSFTFLVDGLEVLATEEAHGIVLRLALPCSEELAPDFAGYAAGRLLREEATLAWDARAASLYLWRELPAGDPDCWVRGFEEFADSCEWWLARCAEKEVPQSVFPDILIRP